MGKDNIWLGDDDDDDDEYAWLNEFNDIWLELRGNRDLKNKWGRNKILHVFRL